MKRTKPITIVCLVLVLVGVILLRHTEKLADAAPSYVFTVSATVPPTTAIDAPASPISAETQRETTEESGDVRQDRSYAVSTSSDIATQVGMAVLEAGGNAVDAAVAVAYTLSVVEPYGSGLGGSGGLLVYDMNTGECVSYDYRGAAGLTNYSYDSVAVPGFVAGMEACHADYGSVSMADLLEPAIYYAENGFVVNSTLAYRLDASSAYLGSYSCFFNSDGSYLTTGDTLYQPALAEVLRAIQSEGADVFYNGWIAEAITAETSLSMDDLASYSVYKRAAVEGYFEDYTVYGAAAPLSGVTLIQMLEMADELDIADPENVPSTYLSQLKQITAAAYGDRYHTIGDHSYYDIDEQKLVSKAYIMDLLELEYKDGEEYDFDYEGTETTSFSIVDANGLVVAATNTLTQSWGSKIMVNGMFMNSTNNNFSSSGINVYEYGKRSRTFTAPTIITGENGYVLAVGTPGGNNIPSRLFTVIVDILKFGENPQAAVSKTGIIYRDGALTIALDSNGQTWFDTSVLQGDVVWSSDGSWWGSISLAGYSDETGAFSAYDTRRGATMSGVYISQTE